MILKSILHIKKGELFAKRFIGTLKAKIYKCMTTISKNAYINKLGDMVN